MLFGNFQIINIYITKWLGKRCREIIESKLNDAQCGFRPGSSPTDQISLSSKFLRNLGRMPKTSTHALSTSRKHTTRFLVKRFVVECCRSTVLTAACLLAVKSLYSWSEVYVRVRRVKSQPFTVAAGLRQGCVLSPLFFIVYIRPAQFRKLEWPNYQHKFAAGRKYQFHFDVEISL